MLKAVLSLLPQAEPVSEDLVEQVADKLAEYFKDPIDMPCSYCEAAKRVISLIHPVIEKEDMEVGE
jgi:hypothetical protein